MLAGLPIGELLCDVGCLGSCIFPRFPSLPVSRRHLLRLAGRLLSDRQLLAACLCMVQQVHGRLAASASQSPAPDLHAGTAIAPSGSFRHELCLSQNCAIASKRH